MKILRTKFLKLENYLLLKIYEHREYSSFNREYIKQLLYLYYLPITCHLINLFLRNFSLTNISSNFYEKLHLDWLSIFNIFSISILCFLNGYINDRQLILPTIYIIHHNINREIISKKNNIKILKIKSLNNLTTKDHKKKCNHIIL